MAAQVVPGSPELTANGGTHYLVGALDPRGTGDTRLALLALTNTRAINTDTPRRVHLRTGIVRGVDAFADPSKLQQKPGPRPLGSNLSNFISNAPDEPLRRLAGFDARTQPTKFVRGQIWTLIDTRLAANGPSGPNGLLWISLRPSITRNGVTGAVTRQGYICVATNNLGYGDIAVSSDGAIALVVAALVGPTRYPSAAYATFSTRTVPDAIHVYRAGLRPDDGFSCYKAFSADNLQTGCRWGDYSMANVSPSGVFWFETEYVTPRLRTTLVNWGTAIGRLPVHRAGSRP